MSTETRPVPKVVQICDLCGDIIPDGGDSLDSGSLIVGYIAPEAEASKTWLWLKWPSDRNALRQQVQSRKYDFHGKCITDLVEANLHNGDTR